MFNFKKLFMFLILPILFLPLTGEAIGQQKETIGFVPDNIWFSEEDLSEGQTVKIYTLIFNGGQETLIGKVEFYDKDVVLSDREFSVVGKETKNISIEWEASAGDHVISARIINPKIVVSGGVESIFLTNNETGKVKIFVSKTIAIKSSISSPEMADEQDNSILDQINKAKNFITDNASLVIKPVKSVVNKFDSFREKTGSSFKEKKEKSFFYGILDYLFSHKILFYALFILIVFFISRFIWRRIF